jgi:plastocyanin
MSIFKNKLYIVLFCLIFIALGAIVANKKFAKKIITDTAELDSVTVSMREDEYIPSELTVKKGTKVTFFNKTSIARWPASNLHPSHEIYPEFDPKEPVMPGTMWDFIFNKTGKWEMHDHLAPYITGSITVTE